MSHPNADYWDRLAAAIGEPDDEAKQRRSMLARLMAMTPEEFFQHSLRLGIIDEDGNVLAVQARRREEEP